MLFVWIFLDSLHGLKPQLDTYAQLISMRSSGRSVRYPCNTLQNALSAEVSGNVSIPSILLESLY